MTQADLRVRFLHTSRRVRVICGVLIAGILLLLAHGSDARWTATTNVLTWHDRPTSPSVSHLTHKEIFDSLYGRHGESWLEHIESLNDEVRPLLFS